MFITINAEKMFFTLIGTLIVIYLFSMLGCTRGLSEQDKQWINNRFNMAVLESKNALLTEENEKLTKENKDLKERINSEIESNQNNNAAEVNEEPKSNVSRSRFNVEADSPSSQKQTSPHSILRVDDKLPDFRNNIRWDLSSGPLSYTGKYTGSRRWLSDNIALPKFQIIYIEDATVDGQRFNPYIRFQKKGARIELENGTRYICASPDGCEVIDFVITKGTIEVYHNENGN